MKDTITTPTEEKLPHNGIYNLMSLGRGRQLGTIDCPFCDTPVGCYLWSISGGGKKCKCGAILYRKSAIRKIKST